MEDMFDKMARPYLEELEAMLATDLTEDEDFNYNEFEDRLMVIGLDLTGLPNSATRSKALSLLSEVEEAYDIFDADGELEAMFDEEDLEEMNEWN